MKSNPSLRRFAAILTLPLLLALLAGCGGTATTGTDAASAEPSATQSVDEVAAEFERVGAGDWPSAAEAIQAAELPATPSGYTPAEMDKVAEAIRSWFTAAHLNPQMYVPHDGGVEPVLSALSPWMQKGMPERYANTVYGPMNYGTTFAQGVTVAGDPRGQAAWTVKVDDDGRLLLMLLTRTLYPVKNEAGDLTIVPIERQSRLSAFYNNIAVGEWGWNAGLSANENIDECASTTQAVYVPDFAADEAGPVVAMGANFDGAFGSDAGQDPCAEQPQG